MKKIFSCMLALFAAVSLYAADLNIYASGLKAIQSNGDSVAIEYTLNTQADSLYFMIYGENINEALCMVETSPAALTKGAHQVVRAIPSNTPAGTYHWAIRAFSTATSFADALNGDGMYNYYLPQDVAVDNNYESPFFGRVYVSEPYDGAADGMSAATKAQTRGIYMYNADMTFVNGDSMAVTGYDGGMGGAHNARNAIKRIAIDDAGYLYIASRDAATLGIWRMDPANPTSPFVQVLAGANTVDAIGIEGDKVYTLEGIGVGTGTLNKYPLGNPLGAPMTLGQDTILGFANSDCDVAADGRGGWWIVENRYSIDAYACLAHLTAAGTVDYIVKSESHEDLLSNSNNAGVTQRGVIAVNEEGNLLAIGSNKTAIVFSVDYNGAEPVLTKLYETGVIGTNIDGVAFDVANNLYILSASIERLLAYPLPKTDNSFVTPAPSANKIYIGVPIPVQHMYLIGDNTGWNPTEGLEMTNVEDNVFEGVFTFTADTSYFAFFDALAENNDQGGWDYVNAHRYAGKDDNVLLNHSAWKDSLRLVNHTLRIPAGQYKLRVDLNNGIVTTFYQAPATISDNAIYISFKDVPGKEGGDNSNRVTTIGDIILAGADYVDSISIIDPSNVYNAREGLGVKLGTGSKTGGFTLHLANAVIPEKIVVTATSYGANEGTAIILGDTVNLASFGNKVLVPVTKIYDGQTPVSEITIQTATKRIYVLNVVIIPAEAPQPVVYKIKHPWDLNNVDPWMWKECEEQIDGTWALEAPYYGGGCNIDPKVLDQDWIGAPVLVGNPYNGDSCRFVINPAATDVAGILTITKLGDPNPDTTQVVIYEHLYEIGANQGWKPNEGVEMTKKADNVFEGTFTFSGTSDSGFDYFGFISELNESWDVVNQHRFGPANDGDLVAIGENAMFENKGAGKSFKIAAGSYTFTVDINNMKLTIAPASGIENINGENNVQKVLRNGQIYIIRDGETYTVTGAKVE